MKCLLLFTLLVQFVSIAEATLNGYESLANWNDLPKAKKGVTSGIASSYDRQGGNSDYNYYLQPAGFQTTDVNTIVTELTGPGIITRFWMPHATANVAFPIKITIDSNTVIETNSNAFLDGTHSYITSPFVYTLVGGQVSYEPIAFQHSIKIESRNYASGGWAKTHHYYQYNYVKLLSSEQVMPYCGTLTPEQLVSRNAAAEMVYNTGLNPAGLSSTSVTVATGNTTISSDSALVICDVANEGIIRCLNIKMPTNTVDAQLESLRLRVRYDNLPNYAVDVPIAHFFGAGFGRVLYRSMPIGTDSPDGFYCYWPMPFKQTVHIEIYNSGSTSATIESAKVEYEVFSVACDMGYFHAGYSKETTVSGQQFHSLLSIQGQGHYVGNLLYLEHAGDQRSMLEADDIIVVNPNSANETILYGTGLEDAYNGGYYYNHVLEQNSDGETGDPIFGIGSFIGLLYIDFNDVNTEFIRSRADQYRWLISDCVPFTNGIDVKIENYAHVAGTTYGSTAFYYLLPKPIDLQTFALFAEYWLCDSCIAPDWCGGNDIDKSGTVNWFDLTTIVEGWLACDTF
jgi:hypothetical protein